MTIEAAVQVLRRYEGTFNANDAEGMNALFWEDSTFVNFSGSVSTNRDDLLAKQRFVFGANGPLHNVSVLYQLEQTIELAQSFVQVVARQRTRGNDDPAQDPMHGVVILTWSSARTNGAFAPDRTHR
ncbi:DUF4440 domain-containing protein [Nocardia sp. NPDC052316]|uniref:DUF4440 domain-containing protein n=1 Tax=Nocardia sp. NPDC052316 TaxID=3364329 RepID=UPI0037CC8AA4